MRSRKRLDNATFSGIYLVEPLIFGRVGRANGDTGLRHKHSPYSLKDSKGLTNWSEFCFTQVLGFARRLKLKPREQSCRLRRRSPPKTHSEAARRM